MTLAYYLAAADRADYGARHVARRASDETSPSGESWHPETLNARRDAEWVRRIGTGDREAFAALYGEYLASMVGFTFRIVRSIPVAEDLCADIFVSLWERRTTWEPKHGARAYLFHAARMRALNHVRHHATEVDHRATLASHAADEAARHTPSIEDALDVDQKLQAVRAVLATLPETRRRVMQLRWHDGFDIVEIAEVLGLSRAAVDQHLSRGLRTMRERLPELFAEG